MQLDIVFINLIILFIPGIIGITLLNLFFVPKIKWDLSEKIFYSIVLGIISYIPQFETLKYSLEDIGNIKNLTRFFFIYAILISIFIVIFILWLNRKGYLNKILNYFNSGLIDNQKNLLDTVYLNSIQYTSDYVTIRQKSGTRYIGRLESYTYKGTVIEIFLLDADWYGPEDTKPYYTFKSILLTFEATDITIEYIKEDYNEQ